MGMNRVDLVNEKNYTIYIFSIAFFFFCISATNRMWNYGKS
jgi:hypothetical protein